VPAAASNAKPAATCEANRRALFFAVSWEEAQHSSLLLRAPLAALAVVVSGTKKELCIDTRLVFFAARVWCDVLAAASNAKPAAAFKASANALALAVSLGRGRSTRGSCARVLRRAGYGRLRH